jgi:MFS family permease
MVSSAGFWMDQVATGWLALEVGGDPRAVGTVLALRLLPFLLFGIVAGTVADRFPRRSILLVVGALAALLAVGVWVFSIGTNAFGYYQVGLVATALTPSLALGVNGGMAALCALLIFAFAPTYRWRLSAVPAPEPPIESGPELSPTRSLPR